MTPREIRFAVNGLTGLVVLSVAAAMATLTWRLAGEGNSPSAVTAATDAYVPPAPPPDISGMINLPPFGRAVVAASATAAPADLILQGVLMAVPASASSALIASGGKESTAYRIGEPLPGGMILSSIGVDYVMLRMGEQYMTLYFPGDQRTGQSAALPNGSQAQAPAGNAKFGSAPIPQTGSPPPLPPQNPSSGNALIDSLGATVTPQGYRVGPSLSPQLQAAGLAPGDVVASVNGVSAATLAADPRRLAQTMGSGGARIEVLRGGSRMTFSLPAR